MDIPKTGNDLREWRKFNNLTQKALANLIGYNKDVISRYERQNSNLSVRFQRELNELEIRLNKQHSIRRASYMNIWDNFTSLGNVYYDEVNVINDSFFDLIDVDPNKHFDVLGPYLDFLGTILSKLKAVKAGLYETDTSELSQEEINSLINKMTGDILFFLKSYID